jgi:hypothetical protein
MKGALKAIVLTSSPHKDHLKLTKEKQNNKELKQQGEQTKEGSTPATKEFRSEVVIEVNHEKWICMLCQEAVVEVNHGKWICMLCQEAVVEVNHGKWICMLCQEAVVEYMVCCEHCEKWAHDSCAGYCKKNSDTSVTLFMLRCFSFLSKL